MLFEGTYSPVRIVMDLNSKIEQTARYGLFLGLINQGESMSTPGTDRKGFPSGNRAQGFRRQCHCHKQGGIRSPLPLRKTKAPPAVFTGHGKRFCCGAFRGAHPHTPPEQTGQCFCETRTCPPQ